MDSKVQEDILKEADSKIEEKKSRRVNKNKQLAEARRTAEDLLISQYPKSEFADKATFWHNLCDNHTYAFVVPTGEELKAAQHKLEAGEKEVGVAMMIGESKVNQPEGDQYNKRIGRAVASSRLSKVVMKLHNVILCEGEQLFNLRLGNAEIALSIRRNPDVPYIKYATRHI